MSYKNKAKMAQYQKEWMRRRRADFMRGKECVKCGATEQLELDHIDPAQKVHHAIWSWSEARRVAEIAKCQVLCRACHWEKTRHDMGYGLKHGTVQGYEHYRCRCRPCTDAKAAKGRRTRERRRARLASLAQAA